MKQLISAILILMIFSHCRKTDSEKKTAPAEIKVDTVTENRSEDIFICQLPIPAEFPGGTVAWLTFLKSNIVYPEIAIDQNIEGTVMVEFKVCTDGTLCDIEAISGPNELKESAIQVFKKSPKWTPTRLNGRTIKDIKRQPIIFRLEDE